MASLEFVQLYMDDLLIITRQTLGKHLQKLEIVLTRLHDVRLEVNAPKSLSVHMKKNPQLHTNQQRNKTPTKESTINTCPKSAKQHFLGMVRYYQDMWARCRQMLAPLTDLVGECRETKTTRTNKAKKKPWKWDQFIIKLLKTYRLL